MIYEKSADELEFAAHLQEQLNDCGLAAARRGLAPQTPLDADGNRIKVMACTDCEDILPPVRVADGRIRCTPCQVVADRLAKRGRL